jgi:branched-chain amino acid transport system substrate-binding protein
LRSVLLAASLGLVVAIAACQSGPASPPEANILIGSDFPISGFFGDTAPAAQAIQLAVEQHPTIGRFRLGYWSLDDAVAGVATPEKGIQNVSQLIDDSRVLGVIGPWTSYMARDEIPLTNSVPLALISSSTTNSCLTRSAPACFDRAGKLRPSGANNFFRIAPPDLVQGAAMAGYLTTTMHNPRVAAVNEWGSDGALYLDSFKTELARNGGQLVYSQQLDPGTTQFGGFLAEASRRGAQVIYALGDTDSQICVVRLQMSSDLIFAGTDGFTNTDACIKQAGANANGMVGTLTDVDATLSSSAAAMKAVREYHKRFPRTGMQGYATFATYDCALMLIEAIQRAVDVNHGGIPTRRQVLDALAQTKGFVGTTGTYTFGPGGDATSPLMTIYKVVDGKWVYQSRVELNSSQG